MEYCVQAWSPPKPIVAGGKNNKKNVNELLRSHSTTGLVFYRCPFRHQTLISNRRAVSRQLRYSYRPTLRNCIQIGILVVATKSKPDVES